MTPFERRVAVLTLAGMAVGAFVTVLWLVGSLYRPRRGAAWVESEDGVEGMFV